MNKEKILIIGEFPIFHKGYSNFFKLLLEECQGYNFYFGILDDGIIKLLTSLEPDIRKIYFDDIKKILSSYLQAKECFLINENNLKELIGRINPQKIAILEGDKSEEFAKKYLNEDEYKNISEYFDVRLRWSDENVQEFKKDISQISQNELLTHQKFMKKALKETEKSKCWWRQVASVIVKDNEIILKGFNKMLPSEDECYKLGCIRDHIQPGKNPEICSATHSEALVISEAANKGISLNGAILYVTHFPCPACAKLVALSGIKKVIYTRGSSVFDGERVLASRGIEIIKI